jgi:hypothetical protein
MGGANDKLGAPKQELFAKFGWMEVTLVLRMSHFGGGGGGGALRERGEPETIE